MAAHVEDAISKGAKVTIGGKKPDLPEPYNKVGHALTKVASSAGCTNGTFAEVPSPHCEVLRVLVSNVPPAPMPSMWLPGILL